MAAASPAAQKRMIGKKILSAMAKFPPRLAGKFAGMLLEVDNSELLVLLEPEQQLTNKAEEALWILEE